MLDIAVPNPFASFPAISPNAPDTAPNALPNAPSIAPNALPNAPDNPVLDNKFPITPGRFPNMPASPPPIKLLNPPCNPCKKLSFISSTVLVVASIISVRNVDGFSAFVVPEYVSVPGAPV